MRMYIFAAALLRKGRLLTTGHLSSRHPVVLGAGDVAWGSRRQVGRKRGRRQRWQVGTPLSFQIKISLCLSCLGGVGPSRRYWGHL